MALIRPISGSFTSDFEYHDQTFTISGKKVYFTAVGGTTPILSIDGVSQTPTSTHDLSTYKVYTYEADNLNNASIVFDGRCTTVTID